MIAKFARGMVYWVNLPNTFGDTVQTGRRPCVIVSNDVGNIFSKNITVVPCTTNIEKINSQPTHYTTNLFVTTESVVLCENIMTISKSLCDGFIGLLDDKEMAAIDKCLEITLGLTDVPKPIKSEEVQEETTRTINRKITDPKVKKQFVSDFENYGPDYVVQKYNVASIQAAYHRKEYYQKQLTKKR